ncbi:transcription elongation factor SPT5 [Capsicum chacoense]
MVEMMNHQEWNSSSRSSATVDVSSFLLFESTGDSEFDSNICSTSDDPMDSLITLNHSHQRFLEDDDAQSCSYDECGHVVDGEEDMEFDFKIDQNKDDDDDDNDGDVDTYSSCYRGFNSKNVGWKNDMKDQDEDEDEDDERGVVEQGWMNGVNRCNKKLKSTNNVSNSVVDCELKTQKDNDKLFWETCLAS